MVCRANCSQNNWQIYIANWMNPFRYDHIKIATDFITIYNHCASRYSIYGRTCRCCWAENASKSNRFFVFQSSSSDKKYKQKQYEIYIYITDLKSMSKYKCSKVTSCWNQMMEQSEQFDSIYLYSIWFEIRCLFFFSSNLDGSFFKDMNASN